MEEGIDITNPAFYASEDLCPDELIAHIFRPSPRSVEPIPLLKERISVLREVGGILTSVLAFNSRPEQHFLSPS